MNDKLVKWVQEKQKTDLNPTWEKIEKVLKTSRTPKKSLKKQNDELINQYINILQTEYILKQLNNVIINIESDDIIHTDKEEIENIKKQHIKRNQELLKQRENIFNNIFCYLNILAIINLEDDTKGNYLDIEFEKDKQNEVLNENTVN